MISTLVIGLSLGCVYSLVAIGYSLIHQTTNAINLAQGAIVMIGGMSASWLLAALNVYYPLAIVGGILCGGLLGMVIAKLIVLPLWNRNIPQIVMMLATMVVSWMVENIVLHLLGYLPQSLPSWSKAQTVQVLGTSVNPHYFWVMLVSFLIVGALQLFLGHTMLGRAMRTTAMNREVASLVGISPSRIALIAFCMAGILGGIGGILIAPVQFTAYNVGSSYSMRGFVAAVLGGFDSIVGALIGGLIIGLVEALAGVYISSNFQDVLVFALLLVVIAVRPNGIIPSKLS